MNWLKILIWFLSGSVVVLYVLPSNLYKTYRIFSLFVTIIVLLITILMWVSFNKNSLAFQFTIFETWLAELNIHWTFGVDGISILFILLTVLIFPGCILASWDLPNSKFLILNLLLIELFLILTFSTLDIFLFCLFFESILIPIYFIITYWGTNERRVKALTYFVIYTLFGSIFFFLALFIIYFELQSTNFFVVLYHQIPGEKQVVIWVLLLISFAIKIPIMPVHLWLLEAHVEAPTVGSVILAALLLKLGSYGILRFLLHFNFARMTAKTFVLTFCLISIIFSSLMALCQSEIKRVIAYSSITHMNFALLGIFSNTLYGIIGGILLIISHGLVSSALFLLVGVLYDRHHTKIISHYGGLVQVIPLFAFFLFLFTISNFSFPGTSNFIGELLVFIGLGYSALKLTLFLASLSTLFVLIFSTLLISRILFGSLKTNYIKSFSDLNRREFAILIPLFLLNLYFGICPNILIETCYFTFKNAVVRPNTQSGVDEAWVGLQAHCPACTKEEHIKIPLIVENIDKLSNRVIGDWNYRYVLKTTLNIDSFK